MEVGGEWSSSGLGKVCAETLCLAVRNAPSTLDCGRDLATPAQRVSGFPATFPGCGGALNRQRTHLVLPEARVLV